MSKEKSWRSGKNDFLFNPGNHNEFVIGFFSCSHIKYHGLKGIFSNSKNMRFVHFNPDDPEIVNTLHCNEKIDLVIIDLTINCHQVINGLIERYRVNSFIILLTKDHDSAYSGRYIKSGVRGLIAENISDMMLHKAINSVCLGNTWDIDKLNDISDVVGKHKNEILRELSHFKLSYNEEIVIRSICSGKTPSQIAFETNKSVKTVSCQKISAMRKLNVKNMAELYRLYGMT